MTDAHASGPAPLGGALRGCLLDETRREEGKREAAELPFLTVNGRQQGDLELLLTGAYSPLAGFMGQAAYEAVLERWRLPDGLPWGMPVVLDVSEERADDLAPGNRLALRDREGVNLAIVTVAERWRPDPERESRALFAGAALPPAGRRARAEPPGEIYLGGTVEGLALPVRYGFDAFYQPPAAVRAAAAARGGGTVLSVHATEPLHRFECEHAAALARRLGAALALHPVDGGADFDSLERMARLRSYQAALKALHARGHEAALYLLPYVPRGALARERLLHAVIRQNYGASHLLCFDGAASPGKEEAERLAALLGELEIEHLAVEPHAYDPARGAFVPRARAPTAEPLPSAPEVVRRLSQGAQLPAWFTYPEVLAALQAAYRPPFRDGVVLFFTGLSGSGKSTIARYVFGRLLEHGSRPVTLLDGDVVRQHLSSELGFSKADRDRNVRRIGYVASEIAKNGGAAICAPIAPYAATRDAVRAMVERNGAFLEIHVATPLEVCETRDPKGLYALARAGKIREFTGISDPYEVPAAPALRIDTTRQSAEVAGEEVLRALRTAGYLEAL